MKPVTLKGHDQSLIALLNGDVDAAVVFQDARNIVKDYPNIFEQTKIVKFTEKIPNDTISVRSDLDESGARNYRMLSLKLEKRKVTKSLRSIFT